MIFFLALFLFLIAIYLFFFKSFFSAFSSSVNIPIYLNLNGADVLARLLKKSKLNINVELCNEILEMKFDENRMVLFLTRDTLRLPSLGSVIFSVYLFSTVDQYFKHSFLYKIREFFSKLTNFLSIIGYILFLFSVAFQVEALVYVSSILFLSNFLSNLFFILLDFDLKVRTKKLFFKIVNLDEKSEVYAKKLIDLLPFMPFVKHFEQFLMLFDKVIRIFKAH